MARIAGINIPQNKLVHIGLPYIYGIGDKFSNQICSSLEIPRAKRIIGRVTCDKCNLTLNKFFNNEEIDFHPCGKEFFIKRKDDNLETIMSRYDIYIKTTEPVLKFLSKNPNFKEIDGTLKIDEITRKIDTFINV